MNKAQFHKQYIRYVNMQLKMDSEIIAKIDNEITKPYAYLLLLILQLLIQDKL